MAGGVELAIAVASIYDKLNKKSGGSKVPNQDILNEENLDTVLSANGNMLNMLSEFIVEPIVVISEDAIYNGTIKNEAINLLLDIFTGYYLQTISILNDLYEIDAKTAIKILSTDNGVGELMKATLKTSKEILTKESGVSNSYENLLSIRSISDGDITFESATLEEDKKGILGNAVLNRNIKVSITVKKENKVINIPITIKARLLKVSTDHIIQVSEPNKRRGNLTTFLDYRAGLASLGDFLLQRKAVEKYKKDRLTGNEFLKVVSERKASAYSRLGTDNTIGFELNYNLLLLTENDRMKIEKELGINIYKDRDKETFLDSVYSLTTIVMDEDYETCTILTPKIRGNSNVSFNEVKKRNSKSNNDMTDLIQALIKNKSIF